MRIVRVAARPRSVVEQERTGETAGVGEHARQDEHRCVISHAGILPTFAQRSCDCASTPSAQSREEGPTTGCYDLSCARRASAALRSGLPPSCWPPPSCAPRASRPAPHSSPTDSIPAPARKARPTPTAAASRSSRTAARQRAQTIRLAIVVLPSISSDVHADPLVFLAGGPGQARGADGVAGAADVPLGPAHARHRAGRPARHRQVEPAQLPRRRRLAARPRANPTTTALEKLRAVPGDGCRAIRGSTPPRSRWTISTTSAPILGYDRVNLYGGSYGTRAALVYLRRHPRARALDRARRRGADGHEPAALRGARRPARRSTSCSTTATSDDGLPRRVSRPAPSARGRCSRGSTRNAPRVRLVHPRTGVAEEIEVTSKVVAGMSSGALFAADRRRSCRRSSSAPSTTTSRGCWRWPSSAKAPTDNMSLGMQLSVLCSEDSPRYTSGDLTREAAGTRVRRAA